MTTVIQENADANNQKKRDLATKINSDLKAIRSVQFSCASSQAFRDTIVIKDTVKHADTIRYRKICLEPRIKVIGWYSSWMKEEYKHYNYNFLSAINLYGYDLDATGKCKNPGDLKNFQKPGGIITTTKEQGCDILLTVYSQAPVDIGKFLNNANAQKTLIIQIDSLIDGGKIDGVNIYFDYIKISDKENFVNFITLLKQNFKGRNKALQLNISIPSIRDDKSFAESDAYDFTTLNSLADYYLVLTDSMTTRNTNIAQSLSPLFNSDKYGKHTIESTINYYSLSKIPISKLILTVSYLGVRWQVNDFTGTLKSSNERGKSLKYNVIYNDYINKQVKGRSIIAGFDPDQVSSYVNITDPQSSGKIQIWYDDFRSLYLKYTWAVENNLGGVSIKGLGYDDGYPELWNSIGAALIKIDTLQIGLKILKPDTVFPPLKIFDYLKIFISDFEWAVISDLEYYNPDAQSYCEATCDCTFNEDTIRKYRDKPIIWHQWQLYNRKINNKVTDNILDNSLQCKCLFARWDVYASIFRWTWIISLASIGLLFLFSRYFERYKVGSGKAVDIIKIAQGIFFVVFIFTISFWLYLSPSVALIGASSSGSNIGILFISMFFGGLLGWIANSWYNKNKRVPKNLP